MLDSVDAALDRIEQAAEKAQAIDLAEGADALDYLRSVYRDPAQSTYMRMKAAIEALPFERPKLAVTAVIDGNDFEGRLKRAIERSGKLIEAKPTAPIESVPIAG